MHDKLIIPDLSLRTAYYSKLSEMNPGNKNTLLRRPPSPLFQGWCYRVLLYSFSAFDVRVEQTSSSVQINHAC